MLKWYGACTNQIATLGYVSCIMWQDQTAAKEATVSVALMHFIFAQKY